MVSNKVNENNKRGFNQMANRQRFKPGVGKQNNQMNDIRNMGAMFNANQLGDNPGFLDFNDDSIASPLNGSGNSSSGSNAGNGSEKGNKNANGGRKMNPNMRRPMKNGAPGMRHRMNGMQNWGPPMAPPNLFPGPPPSGRRGPMNPPPIPPHPAHFRNAHGGGMRMRGPQNGRFGAGPQGPISLLAMNRPPLPAPIPPMAGRPMQPPMGRMMPPPMHHGPNGPGRRQVNGNLHGRGMHPFPRNGMPSNGAALNMNGKRPRTKGVQNREEYPLDKPWVTEEIKAEHDKKADLANRLKGHRDDALFAQFKEQRDKFVKMYEAARAEFEKKTPAQDVEKTLTEASPCKKARSENVEKSNDGAVSADKLVKTDEANFSSALGSAPTDTSPSDTTECATGGSTTGSVVSASASTAATSISTTTSNASTLDTTAISSTASANAEEASTESAETLPVAAGNPVVATEANETDTTSVS